MGRLAGLLFAALPLLLSCKGKPDGNAETGAEPATADASQVAPGPAPPGSGPDWLEIWSSLGVAVDRGAVDRIDDKFLRVVQSGADRSGLMQHYQARVVAAGWALGETEETENHLRADLTRDHLMLTLIAQDQEGGAFVGLSAHQDWRAMEFPLEGATQTLAEANRFHATYLEGTTSPQVATEIGAHLTGSLGWTRDRNEPMDAPAEIIDPLATWYHRGRRTIRVQTHAQADGIVQLTMRAGWR